MKKLLLILCSVCLIFTACGKQNKAAAETNIDSQKAVRIVMKRSVT